ncbi:MAG: hypothetical protein KIT88_08265 [Phycisphaeraceae bacterium]|nr:hypothetical protein [Phycisphaeraceae bacterium]
MIPAPERMLSMFGVRCPRPGVVSAAFGLMSPALRLLSAVFGLKRPAPGVMSAAFGLMSRAFGYAPPDIG